MMTQTIDIQNFLPHRKPMLMVDMILHICGEKVTTVFKIEEDNIFVDNGFFTEVGLIENAAQTCSSIVARAFFEDSDIENKNNVNVLGFISAIRTLKIHALPKSGSEIITKSFLISKYNTELYTTCLMDCKIFCGEELLLEGEINLFIQEEK